MSAPNPFISNGTCYFAAGQRAASLFYPCGNAALGHKACCGAGDWCLSSNACFNLDFGLTYLAGCSDPEYKDESCPDKIAGRDNPWVGLVYCNGTSNEWVACPQAGKQSTLTSADFCFCPSTSRTVAFTDAATLENIGSLQFGPSETLRWAAGHIPTAIPTVSASSTSSSTASNSNSGTASPTSSSTDTPNPPAQAEGLSTSAKIGIGVGIGVGGTLLVAALAFFLFSHRRKQKRKAAELESSPEAKSAHTASNSHTSGGLAVPDTPMTPATPATLAPSELESTAARPWSLRSELQTSSTPPSLAEQHGMGAIRDARIPDGGLHPSQGSPQMGHTPSGGRGPLSPVAELPG